MTKYLQRRYSFFGTSRQNEELQKILTRLQISGKFEKGSLSVIVSALLNEGWNLPKIMAHLDLVDLEERT
jgi:hypothetical protein